MLVVSWLLLIPYAYAPPPTRLPFLRIYRPARLVYYRNGRYAVSKRPRTLSPLIERTRPSRVGNRTDNALANPTDETRAFPTLVAGDFTLSGEYDDAEAG